MQGFSGLPMRVDARAIAASAVLFLCTHPVLAKELSYTPVTNGEQTVEYSQGVGTFWSGKDLSEVELVQSADFTSKRSSFRLAAWNLTGSNLDVDISDVSAEYGGKPLHVYTTTELKKIVKGRANWSSFGVAFVGGLTAGLATSASTVTTHGRVGNTSYSSTSTIYTPDYEARANIYARTDEAQEGIDASRDSIVDRIDQVGLQRTTLNNDLEFWWKIVIDEPRRLDGSKLKISVRVGEDVHVFEYDVAETE